MAVFGPKLTARDRTRIALSQGKVYRKSKGVTVDLDVSPMYLAVADGLAVAADDMLQEASSRAPFDPATPGNRIPDSGIWGVYAFGKILTTGGPGKYSKPRSFHPIRDGVDAVITFTSPLHHLHELGTVRMTARPYLGPAKNDSADKVPRTLQQNWPR